MNTPEQVQALRAEIESERNQIGRLLNELEAARARPSDRVYLRATASILHDFYNGVERVFSAVVKTMNSAPPGGAHWHKRLLLQTSRPIPEVRPEIITESLAIRLQKYLDFRHRFRHMYGFELEAEELERLCIQIPTLWVDLRASLDRFDSFLSQLTRP